MITLKNRKVKIYIALFLLPALIVYLLFQIVPLILAFYFSLVEWNGISGAALKYVGLKNYLNAFHNVDFLLSIKNMVKMVFFSVLFHTPIALLTAVAINTRCKGYRAFKALFFVPTVFPLTSVGLMWYFVFMPTGSLNALLKNIGLADRVVPWLVDPATAMNTIVFVNIWAGIGYYMVILLAGLTTIPDELYEAASIDGATSVHKFFEITVPMLKSTISMCILMDIIGSVKVFDLVFAMTGGGPNGLTNLPTTLMYNEAFKYSHYGLGSAIGIIILIACLAGTLGSNFIMSRKHD
ncbi:carbohydrate ABC transporter permease [Lacrimispora sp.]|uniref:carbohydrate ABC transporter permease n=1 Tax=Lacrimispora sp. TaxID=2719234 RepID=UPI0028AC34C6|nr:sugar ABC transporter permease [Lacrimispora sp.]